MRIRLNTILQINTSVSHLTQPPWQQLRWRAPVHEKCLAQIHMTRPSAYVQGGPTKWVEHWMQRLSMAAVAADARRCLRRMPGLRAKAARDAAARHGAIAGGAARRA